MFHNVNLYNLQNVLQRNLGTDRTGESIFRVSGGRSFCVFDVQTSLPIKSLDMSLVGKKFVYFRIIIYEALNVLSW